MRGGLCATPRTSPHPLASCHGDWLEPRGLILCAAAPDETRRAGRRTQSSTAVAHHVSAPPIRTPSASGNANEVRAPSRSQERRSEPRRLGVNRATERADAHRVGSRHVATADRECHGRKIRYRFGGSCAG